MNMHNNLKTITKNLITNTLLALTRSPKFRTRMILPTLSPTAGYRKKRKWQALVRRMKNNKLRMNSITDLEILETTNSIKIFVSLVGRLAPKSIKILVKQLSLVWGKPIDLTVIHLPNKTKRTHGSFLLALILKLADNVKWRNTIKLLQRKIVTMIKSSFSLVTPSNSSRNSTTTLLRQPKRGKIINVRDLPTSSLVKVDIQVSGKSLKDPNTPLKKFMFSMPYYDHLNYYTETAQSFRVNRRGIVSAKIIMTYRIN